MNCIKCNNEIPEIDYLFQDQLCDECLKTKDKIKLIEKPILFNTEMVQAILSGSKSQTRRIMKKQPPNKNCHADFYDGEFENKKPEYFDAGDNNWACRYCGHGIGPGGNSLYRAPYRVGDVLWVRETWQMQSMSNFDKRAKFLYKAEPNYKLKESFLSADRYEDLLKFSYKKGWQPSLFMPKEAARIFLIVTDVRVERVQDITDDGAKSEGINPIPRSKELFPTDDYIYPFMRLWDSIYKDGDINPWVWVIEFERVEVEV